MSEKLKNPPAFPGYGDDQGMDLLDWFAGQALAGELASQDDCTSFTAENVAARCYNFAEAMLQAREYKMREMANR